VRSYSCRGPTPVTCWMDRLSVGVAVAMLGGGAAVGGVHAAF
jgi:hypothetical protein